MKKLIGKLVLKMVGGIDGVIELLGGVSSLIEWAVEWFNDSILQKVSDKDEFCAYATDVENFGAFMEGVFDRHQKWMTDGKRTALGATIDSIKELAAALKDCTLSKEEISALVEKVVAAIEAWKQAK